MASVNVVVTFGFLRPRRAVIFRPRYAFAVGIGSVSRPWLRYALIVEATGGTDVRGYRTYKVIGHRWTRRGARHAVDTLRRAQ